MGVSLSLVIPGKNVRTAKDYEFVKKETKVMTEVEKEEYKKAKKEHQDFLAFKNNIKNNGQIVPIAVKQLENGTYELIAGYRRFNAIQQLHQEEIEKKVAKEEYKFHEIEIAIQNAKAKEEDIQVSENTARKNFEVNELQKMVYEARIAQQIENEGKEKKEQKGWNDLANKFGFSIAYVRKLFALEETRLANLAKVDGAGTDKVLKEIALDEISNRTKILAKELANFAKQEDKHKFEIKEDLEAIIRKLQEKLKEVNNDEYIKAETQRKRVEAIKLAKQ